MSEIIIYRPTDEAYLLYLPKFAPNLVCGIRERCLDLDDEDYYKIGELKGFDCGDIVFSYLDAIHSKVNEYQNFPNVHYKKMDIKRIRKKIRELIVIHNTILSLINYAKDYHTISKEEQNNIINRYNKVKHLAYLYKIVVQDELDDETFNECLTAPDEIFIERTDEYLQKELNGRAAIAFQNCYPDHHLVWVRDQEAIFTIDLYNLIFNCNAKTPFNVCIHCGWVYDTRRNKTNLCPECSAKIQDVKNECEKNYKRILSNLFMRSERANLSNNLNREHDCEKAKEDFKSYYKNELSSNIAKYGEIKGREITIANLEEYHNNLKKTALPRGRKKKCSR